MCCSINGNDTCTELLLESKGSVIVNLPDAKGRYGRRTSSLVAASAGSSITYFCFSKIKIMH